MFHLPAYILDAGIKTESTSEITIKLDYPVIDYEIDNDNVGIDYVLFSRLMSLIMVELFSYLRFRTTNYGFLYAILE